MTSVGELADQQDLIDAVDTYLSAIETDINQLRRILDDHRKDLLNKIKEEREATDVD